MYYVVLCNCRGGRHAVAGLGRRGCRESAALGARVHPARGLHAASAQFHTRLFLIRPRHQRETGPLVTMQLLTYNLY